MKIFISALIVFFSALSAQAGNGGVGYDHGNGGDICENRFVDVRDDLKFWINNGGSENLVFPEGITLARYNTEMLKKMELAKVHCVDKRHYVGAAEKTCKNYFEADGSLHIQCNRNLFLSTAPAEQYVLVHHEYAGLAGFEVNNGEASSYVLSKQITGNLDQRLSDRLVVKRPGSSEDVFKVESCLENPMSLDEARATEKRNGSIIAPFETHSRIRFCSQTNECEKWRVTDNVVRLYKHDPTSGDSYVHIEKRGRLMFTSTADFGLQLLSYPGGPVGRGTHVTCGSVERFDGTCSISSITRNGMQYIGEGFGVVGPSCTRIAYTQKRFDRSNSRWVEQELIFFAKY